MSCVSGERASAGPAPQRLPLDDDVGAELPGELGHHRSDRAGGAVGKDALPHLETTVLEQALPRGQPGDRQARTHREVDVPRQRRKVAGFHGRVLGQGSIAVPVGDPEHPLSQRDSAGTKPEAWTSTTTSLIAGVGSGRSARVIPAAPAA